VQLGLRNVPDATELKNLHALTAALEDVLTVLGNKPILILRISANVISDFG